MATKYTTREHMAAGHGVSRTVLIRDLLIFQLKLTLDSMKDVVLSPLSIFFAILGILFGGKDRGRWFYRVMRWGERFDLWLNLFGAAKRADSQDDGLFGVSKAGSPTLLGQLEQRARGGDTRRKSTQPPSDLELAARALHLTLKRTAERRASSSSRLSRAA